MWNSLKSTFTPTWETLTQIVWLSFWHSFPSLFVHFHSLLVPNTHTLMHVCTCACTHTQRSPFVAGERSQYVSIELSADSALCVSSCPSGLHGIVYKDSRRLTTQPVCTVWDKTARTDNMINSHVLKQSSACKKKPNTLSPYYICINTQDRY